MISIIIPVFNHAHTLKRCFFSIFKQTARPLEVIVVNDGSIDNFKQTIGEILAVSDYKELNIKVVEQENAGASLARNMGFRESKGDYVIFWDADTIARPEMLKKMIMTLQNNSQASYVYCQFRFGWKKMKSHKFDPILLKKMNYIDTTSLIRRVDFPVRGFDESLKRFQDWDLWLTMLAQNKTGVLAPEILFKKIVSGRKGMSSWLPSFMFKLPWKCNKVLEYEQAREVILKKHLN